jgi:steroid 5-alpha reductase family enzyme
LVHWIGQAAWVFVVGLPVYLLGLYDVAKGELPQSARQLGITELAGLAIWALGFYLEARADEEKETFRHGGGASSSRPWIDTGLWSLSRHPNHLGEILLWTGQCAMIAPFFWHAGSYLLAAVCFASPMFTIIVILASGIPRHEAEADRKWGERADYRAYKSRVPMLVPGMRTWTGIPPAPKQQQHPPRAEAVESEIKTSESGLKLE